MELLYNFVLHLFRFLALPHLGKGELHQGEAVHLGEGGHLLGEPEGSSTGEVLARLGEEKFCLGEPGIVARCRFPTVLYIVQDGFRKSS